MKQRRVGEHAIKTATRQVELEEILLPYFAAAVGARHRGGVWGALQTNRDMTAFGKRLEVASRPAAEIEYREGRFALNESQQRRDVLADVVIARPCPKILGTPVVVFQREGGDFFQVLLIQFHALHPVKRPGERKDLPVGTEVGSFILKVYCLLLRPAMSRRRRKRCSCNRASRAISCSRDAAHRPPADMSVAGTDLGGFSEAHGAAPPTRWYHV